MTRAAALLALLALLVTAEESAQPAPGTFRVLSWNVSGDMPVEQPANFLGHLRLADPDLVLLDEVQGSLTRDSIEQLFAGQNPRWHLLWGERGGRQRIVMLTRSPLTAITAFQTNAYSQADRDAVLAAAPPDRVAALQQQLDAGIPVNAAIVRAAGRRLLVAAADLECCAAQQWQQVLRLAESRAIRQLVEQAVKVHKPDGVIVAGDFNLAVPPAHLRGIGVLPLIVLSGPYPAPIHGLIAAEAVHKDRQEVWTIHSGDGSPFPAMPFDFQLYSPHSLRLVEAYVMDSADLSASALARAGLKPTSSSEFSNHRPVVGTYQWK